MPNRDRTGPNGSFVNCMPAGYTPRPRRVYTSRPRLGLGFNRGRRGRNRR